MSADKGKRIADFNIPDRLVLVAGSEGKGLRNLTQKNCDVLINIPLEKKIEQFKCIRSNWNIFTRGER